jgi:hypothetical protein
MAVLTARARRRCAARIDHICRRHGTAAAVSRRRRAGRPLRPHIGRERLRSRTHYFWAGGGYQYYGEREGDQMGASVFYSAVYAPFLVGPTALLLYKQYGLEAACSSPSISRQTPARREVSLRQLQLLFLAQVDHEQQT